jgi:hypothetical protein
MIEKELGTEEAEKNHPAYVELPASIHTVKELIRPMLTAHRFDESSKLGTMLLAWIRKALIQKMVMSEEIPQMVWGWAVAQKLKESTGSTDQETLHAIVDGFAMALTESVLDEFKVKLG